MNKTRFTCMIRIGALWFLLLSPMPMRAIPDHKNENSGDTRSFPIFIGREGDVVYLYSNKEILYLQMEIKDLSGNTLQEEYIALPAQVSYPVCIGDLPIGESYSMVICEDGNRIATYTINL